MEKPFDPAAMWRDMLGQWEQSVNKLGGDAMRTEQFAQTMGSATGAAAHGQQATHEMMTRWLAALNMPSRAEFADLSARLARIEEAVHRIEAAVAPRPSHNRPRPRRTRAAPPPPAPKAPKS